MILIIPQIIIHSFWEILRVAVIQVQDYRKILLYLAATDFFTYLINPQVQKCNNEKYKVQNLTFHIPWGGLIPPATGNMKLKTEEKYTVIFIRRFQIKDVIF